MRWIDPQKMASIMLVDGVNIVSQSFSPDS